MLLPLPFLLNFISKLISQDNIITFGSIGLIFYIVALILSKTTKCIIIWHWWDIIILSIPGIIFLGSFFIIVNNSDGGNVEFINNIALNILFLFSFIVTIVLSIIANVKYSGILKSLVFIITAIAAKTFIAILIPVFIVLFFGVLNSGKKDKRYRSGTEGNQNIIVAGIIAAIAALLIGTLIKKGSEED
jgi:hypothetical protein